MPKRTALDFPLDTYGQSVNGVNLEYFPPRKTCELLIVAGIHGEEPETTVALSRAVRSLQSDEISSSISLVLSANPDGLVLGTRGNANGVDLNRNFPSTNWQSDPTTCRWHVDESEELPILTGSAPASEPESKALIELIDSLSPKIVLTLHGPLACVDDPDGTPLAGWIAKETGFPLVTELGYPHPRLHGNVGERKKSPLGHLGVSTGRRGVDQQITGPHSREYTLGESSNAHIETITQISSCLPSPVHPPSKNEEGSRSLLSFCNRGSCELL
jgi:protein MpaA